MRMSKHLQVFINLGGMILGAGALAAVSAQMPIPGNKETTPSQTTAEKIRQASGRGDFDPMSAARRPFPTDGNNTRTAVYRKPTKKDWQLAAPAPEDRARYAEFLKQPRTGLVRLLSDEGCQENLKVKSATEFCVKYENIYGGSAFSFRTENYTLGRFADVAYKNGTLYGVGRLTLGALVDLGPDVALENVSAATRGARYLYELPVPQTAPEIETALEKLQQGVERDGFKYRRWQKLQENHTYLLRSVAYRRSVETKRTGLAFDDLAADERRDVIVALRVVRFGDAPGSVTLVWKELQRKESPKISVKDE